MNVNRALGTAVMLWDIIPTLDRPKLTRAEPGTAEFDLMLATLVFDLVKKNAMLHRALREFALHADPDITRQYLDDIRRIEPLEQDYAALAGETEAQMLREVAACVEDHRALAEMVERWGHDGEASSSSS